MTPRTTRQPVLTATLALLLTGLSLGVGATAAAQTAGTQAPPEIKPKDTEASGEATAFDRHRLWYLSGTFGRYNPQGLSNLSEIGYRFMLFNSDNLLFKDTYLMLGLTPGLSPAYTRIGVMVQAKPLAVLRLTARYERFDYFGSFNILQSFDTPTAEHSDTKLIELGDADTNYKTHLYQTSFEALVQAKVKSIAARTNFRALHYDVADLREGDTVFFDAFSDAVVANGGWMLSTDTDVLWTNDVGPTIGLRHTWLGPMYDDDDFRPGEPTDQDNSIHRLGPLIAYKLWKEPGTVFDEPTFFALIQWHLKHRFRTGEDVSQAIPLVAVGFAISGEILSF